MKKILNILFISGWVLILSSCNTKTGADKDFENMKDSVNKSIDKAADKTKEDAGEVKDSWNQTKDAVDKKADTITVSYTHLDVYKRQGS